MRDITKKFLVEMSGYKRVYGDINLDDFSEDLRVARALGSTELVNDESGKKKFVRLTSNRNQNGRLVVNDTLTFGDDGFIRVRCTFRISENGGARDADGPGADGIKLILVGSKGEIEVFIDTYHNIEDASGNHIDLSINGTKIDEAYYKHRLNNDKIYTLQLELRNGVITVGIESDESMEDDTDDLAAISPLIAHPLNVADRLGKELTIQVIGITGAGYQTQDVLGLSYQSNYHLDF